MPSLSPKDRVSLCLFSFTDGRRCRTPRTGNHPLFCFYHAQKEARARTAEALAKDLACFFSGDYLSACDLSTAMARLIPAVVRGDIKPTLARTVAYMFQTQLQAIHLSQHEYTSAFGTDGWRKAIRTSVNSNYDYRFPTTPKPEHTEPRPAQPTFPASVGARLARPASPTQPAHPTQIPSCPQQTGAGTPQPPPAAPTNRHATQPPNAATPSVPPSPQPRPSTPNRDPYAVHFDHHYRLRTDGNPF